MAINKFVDRQGNTLLDLSADSVTSENFVLAGKTYHGPDGVQHTGTLNPGPLDYSQYNFIDYDGTLLYSYTDEQLDALTVLPIPKDHTDENLEFQGWNWTLTDLKAWDRTRPDRPLVGANYITIDRKSYLYLDTPYADARISFDKNGTLNSVDWGDGTVNTTTEHTYANPGKYVIVIDMAEGNDVYFSFGYDNPSKFTNKQWITNIKLGNVKSLKSFSGFHSLKNITIPNSVTSMTNNALRFCYNLQSISIPNGVTHIQEYSFDSCYSLQNISLPNSVTRIGTYTFYKCASLKNISIPNSVTSIENSMLSYCHSLQNISIPNSLTSIKGYTFSSCHSLQNISIPNSVTSIENGSFDSCYSLTLDLTKQTKVITLTTDIGLSFIFNKILVPNSLLTDYKAASYWSNYASIMVGV